jgi:hypothetical protein
MIDPIEDAKSRVFDLLAKHNAAKRAGDYAKADDFYSESLFFIKLLRAAGEDVEHIR